MQVQVVKTGAVDILWKAPACLLQHQGLDQFQSGFHIPEILHSSHHIIIIYVEKGCACIGHRCSPKVPVPLSSKSSQSQSWRFRSDANGNAQISRPILISGLHLKFSSNCLILPHNCLFSARKQRSNCQSSALGINLIAQSSFFQFLHLERACQGNAPPSSRLRSKWVGLRGWDACWRSLLSSARHSPSTSSLIRWLGLYKR